MTTPTKTVAFFGASTGIGLAALKLTLAAGHTCIALCRVPSKLEALHKEYPALRVVEGNAHDSKAVSDCLIKSDGTLVDEILFSIGGKPVPWSLTIDDPKVCEVGITVLLESITQLRNQGKSGKPLIIAVSTTGTSSFGRDYPLVMYPIYNFAIAVARDDKIVMTDKLASSGEDFCVVRASLLVDGESDTAVRVGIEDPEKGREKKEIGYTISREDAGKWIAENLILGRKGEYVNKIVSITW
ncbi:uncharacterized protein FIESC28_04154 [Fusarium coffeatum]|uniref:NAD(P)-binding domain-containing protein n=1 Tax=Fusarium coffeatum TaxID=231269 RepID=A0A366S1G2_9HYPO|nr:uncharacterized protein FIESC28_04154 [Fusarium coffeatum]RBR23159.1 hypothetical protein FIESC28_04154 [Fusarium coffeatum]